jgi:hypothetical protein
MSEVTSLLVELWFPSLCISHASNTGFAKAQILDVLSYTAVAACTSQTVLLSRCQGQCNNYCLLQRFTSNPSVRLTQLFACCCFLCLSSCNVHTLIVAHIVQHITFCRSTILYQYKPTSQMLKDTGLTLRC